MRSKFMSVVTALSAAVAITQIWTPTQQNLSNNATEDSK